jgi:CheY-like chemotaxis protein
MGKQKINRGRIYSARPTGQRFLRIEFKTTRARKLLLSPHSVSLMRPALIRQAKILIVDDEIANVRLLQVILADEGYENISATTDSRDVLEVCEHDQPDLILLDLHMPDFTGYEVMEKIAALQPADAYLPIIVLTADPTPEAKRRALTCGATDFVCKPFDNPEVIQRIKNALQTRYLHLAMVDQNQVLRERVKERTALLEATLDRLNTAQEQAVQQERLRALGKMTAGIAHDFNNLLSLILGYGELLLREIGLAGSDDPAAQYLRNMISASEDGVEMVKRLATFQRPPSESDPRQSIHLPDLINQAVELTRPRWQNEALASNINISVSTDFAQGADIVGDPAQFRDLLVNSIFNAVDAMPNGGTLTFRTHAAADSVVIEIEDTGVGMSEETRERCLEPFFTTKGVRGSGLGLAMIYGITQRHKGSLEIETQLGRGTKIAIRLPNEPAPAVREDPALTAASEPLRVLVVDDQPLLCEILVDYLQKDGHSTATATGGEEALEKFQTEPFDLLITDSAMPGMSGHELAAAIRKFRHGTMVILLTGFAESGVSSSIAPEIDAVVGKPVLAATLRQAIAQTIVKRRSIPATTEERLIPTAGFLRTGPEGALMVQRIKDRLDGDQPTAPLVEHQTRS